MEVKKDVMETAPKRRRWIKPVIIVAVIAVIILSVAAGLNLRKQEAPNMQERLQPVEVADVLSRPFSEELRVAGTVTPFAEAKLSPKVMGRVSSVSAVMGQRVEAGQTLLTIDKSDYYTALRQAEVSLEMARANSIQAVAAYENAKLNYQRTEELYKQGAVSMSQLEGAGGQLAAAESGYRSNQAQIAQSRVILDKARLDYSNTEIKAPFAGVIARRMAEVGEMVSQVPVFTIIQDHPLLVKVNIPENSVSRVSPEQKVDVFVAATGKTYKGTVTAVAPQADSQTRAFAAEIKIDGGNPEVKPGMVADLIINVKQVEEALLVPTDALLDEDGGSGVFVVENGVARHRKVGTGIVGQGYTQIISGLRQGESVAVRGNHLLVDGMKVRVEGTRKESGPRQGGESR